MLFGLMLKVYSYSVLGWYKTNKKSLLLLFFMTRGYDPIPTVCYCGLVIAIWRRAPVDIGPYETNFSLLWESHSHGDNYQNNGPLFSGLSCLTPRFICMALGSVRL